MRRFVTVLLLLGSLAAICARADTIAWVNTNGGNWSDTSNWNPNQVPGSTDTAIITNAGDYTVTLDVDANVGGLVLGSGDGTTQTFLLNDQSFTLAGQGTVNSNGVVDLDGGTLNFSGTILTNCGTVVWNHADIAGESGPQIYNYGLWDAQANRTLSGVVFNNYGTFRKSGGTADDFNHQTTLDNSTAFNNYGTVDVQVGDLLSWGGNASGTFSISDGASIDLESYSLDGDPTFTGPGFTGGSLTGSNAVIHGSMDFVYGSLSGVLTLASNATINLDGSLGVPVLSGVIFTNYGIVNWGFTDLHGRFSPQIYNYGLWDAQSNDTFYGAYNSGGTTTFNNYGTFSKSGGAIPSSSSMDNNTTFNNYGTVDVQTGALYFDKGSDSGMVNTATNAYTGLVDFVLTGNPTFAGSGFAGGSLTGCNAVIHGSMTLFFGSLSGTLTLASNSVMVLSAYPQQPISINGAIFTNYGTVIWTLNDLNGQSSPQIYNYGLWDAQDNRTFYGAYSGGAMMTFNNYGTFRKSGGTQNPPNFDTLFDNNTIFNNYGTADVQTGSLALNGSYSLAGGTLNFGINGANDFGSLYLGTNAPLTGTLSVNLNNGYFPAVSNSFAVVYYISKVSMFSELELPSLPSPLSWHSHYGSYTFALSVVAPARTFMVTDTNDTLQTTSLRGAIIAANQRGGTNVIILGENPGPYRLTVSGADGTAQTGDLNIASGELTIVGAGSHVTIDATGLGDRVFRVSSNALLTLRNLVIQGGSPPSGSGFADGEPGGAIFNAGTLSLDHCIVANNSSGPGHSVEGNGGGTSGGDGGGIYNKGVLWANHCTIVGNACGSGVDGIAGGSGGGIRNDGFCFLAFCIIAGNQAGAGGGPAGNAGGFGGGGGNGGAIFNVGTMHLTACIIGTNAAGSGAGGGDPSGFVQIGSPGGFGGNGGNGGGIYNVGRMEIDFSTVCGNSAGNGGSGGSFGSGGSAGKGGNGGGILNIGSLSLMTSTISDNLCGNGATGGDGYFGDGAAGGVGGSGGGIYNAGLNSLACCTIALNTTGSGGNGGNGSGSDAASGGNGGDGGGVWNEADGIVETRDTLIALNLVNIGGMGGTNSGSHILPLDEPPPPPTIGNPGSDGLGFDVAGDFNSQGFNLVSTADYSLGFTNGLRADKIGSNANPIDPLLGPLQMNGGFTPTHALLWGSPAIDQGNCGRVRLDQRGHHRPFRYVSTLRPVRGDGSDIGAFELDTPQGP